MRQPSPTSAEVEFPTFKTRTVSESLILAEFAGLKSKKEPQSERNVVAENGEAAS